MKNVKTIAIYLPQYYETEYNNKWWGTGYTEWVAVKNATPCFEGHKQPKSPLNDYYYNLLDRSTFEHQERLMKKYGIYGLCFYHYYFKDGIKVLEKPVENLLKWKDIDIPFCFSWPNERWIRTWSNFYGAVWGEKFDKESDQAGNGVLLEQDYGSKKEWKQHFDYLNQFFQDRRYIKIDGKPVFIFHSTEVIPCLKEMTEYWNQLAIDNGLRGMYFIGANVSGYRNELDAVMIYEPRHSRKELLSKGKYEVKNGVTCFEYSDFVQEILSSKPFSGIKTYYCGLTGYDTTPRRGHNGECLLNNSCEQFKKLMDGLYAKSINDGNEYLFINAWNEWGEGMYIEPDKENGYDFLEVVKNVNDQYKNVEVVQIESNDNIYDISSEINMLNEKISKYQCLYDQTIMLATIIQSNSHSIVDYFKYRNMDAVAVYGVGAIGRLLINELIIKKVKISYTVDIYAARVRENIPMYRPYEDIPQADILIVTAYGSEKIIEEMRQKGLQNVVSIETWMNDLLS